MIASTELRIGNYTDKGCVTALPMGRQHSEWNIECDYHDYDFEEINPIPLTEDWLLRFGFEKKETNFGYSKETEEGNIFINNYFVFNFDGFNIAMSTELKSVHQLQNLFFALTGEELKLSEI